MFLTQDFLPDPKRFLEERFGFGVLAHVLIQPGHVIAAHRRVGMFRAQDLLPDPERFLEGAVRLWRTRPLPGTARPGY